MMIPMTNASKNTWYASTATPHDSSDKLIYIM